MLAFLNAVKCIKLSVGIQDGYEKYVFVTLISIACTFISGT